MQTEPGQPEPQPEPQQTRPGQPNPPTEPQPKPEIPGMTDQEIQERLDNPEWLTVEKIQEVRNTVPKPGTTIGSLNYDADVATYDDFCCRPPENRRQNPINTAIMDVLNNLQTAASYWDEELNAIGKKLGCIKENGKASIEIDLISYIPYIIYALAAPENIRDQIVHLYFDWGNTPNQEQRGNQILFFSQLIRFYLAQRKKDSQKALLTTEEPPIVEDTTIAT